MGAQIPYKDLSMIPGDLRNETLFEIGRVMRFKNTYECEQYVANVERDLSQYFQTRYCVAVDSGTTALQLSLTASGVREGDEVILPTYTYVATALAVTNLGARPVFIDVINNDLTINPDLIESSITSKTRAVIPVHIHGLCCDMGSISDICRNAGVALIEDASQSHGAVINNRKTGTFGIGCFSMHTSKNLGGIGDAGLIVLDDEEKYQVIQAFLKPDSGTKDVLNARRTPCTMDAIQAAIIQKKLAYLEMINQRKREIARQYDELIDDPLIKKPVPLEKSTPVYRDYFILTDERDELQEDLSSRGIETKSGYRPLHQTKTFEQFVGSKRLTVIDTMSDKVLLLPCHWGMTDDQVEYVCATINEIRNVRT